VLGAVHAIVPPATDTASGASSFLSFAGTDGDQGLNFGSDQNGLLTKTSALGNDPATDLSVTGGVQTNGSITDTHLFSGGHAVVPPDKMSVLSDHDIAAPVNMSVAGGEQVIAPPVKTSGLDEHTISAPINTPVLGAVHAIVPPVTGAAGNASSFLSAAGTDGDQGLSLDTDGLHGGVTQSLLTSLLNELTGSKQDTVSLQLFDSKLLTDSTIVDASSATHSEAAHSMVQMVPTNEYAPASATSPTLASATFGTLGNDNFAFHQNLGSEPAQNAGAQTNELAHNNIQVGGPALGSTAPELHAEFALDVVHVDDTHVSATVDQFHQMAANSTLLH
jgi:hypothetical protein